MATQNIDKNSDDQGRLPDVACSAKNYRRLLEMGEVIRTGDMHMDDLEHEFGEWHPVPNYWVGRAVDENIAFYPIYRSVNLPNVQAHPHGGPGENTNSEQNSNGPTCRVQRPCSAGSEVESLHIFAEAMRKFDKAKAEFEEARSRFINRALHL